MGCPSWRIGRCTAVDIVEMDEAYGFVVLTAARSSRGSVLGGRPRVEKGLCLGTQGSGMYYSFMSGSG